MQKSESFYVIKFVICATVITCIAFALAFALSRAVEKRATSAVSSPSYCGRVIVIDAGHGGEDGGAVASDGTLEKDLNFEVARLIKALCDLNGTQAIMTREDDSLLYDRYGDLESYTGHKKEYDLKNRVRIASELENPVFISIHMNKFNQEKYSGVQIYYSKNNPASQMLARSIQNMTRQYLQPTNKRAIKQADSSIFVLDKLECPSVLIECGFLSNQNELELLKTSEHQSGLALTIFLSVISVS